MKKLYTFLGIIIVCVGVLSGCKTLFDVAPTKGIYSPIELNILTTKVTYTKDVVPVVDQQGQSSTVIVDNSTIQFKVTEDALYYGAVLFYDSLNAVELIKNNRFVGTHELYFQEQNKGNSGVTRTAKVRIDPNKGQSQYIVPVAYASDSTIIYNAQGLIRTTISPWSHFADIIPPTISQTATLIQGGETLSYAKISNNETSCYRYNIGTKKFDIVGSSSIPFSNTIAYGSNVNTQNISPTGWIFYRNSRYYMVTRVSESKVPPSSQDYNAGRFGQTFFSILTLDKDFKYIDLSSGTGDLLTNGVHSTGDILAANLYLDTLRVFYNTSTISTANRLGMATYPVNGSLVSDLNKSSPLQDFQNSLNVVRLNPTLTLMFNDKFIFNNFDDQKKLRIATVSKSNYSINSTLKEVTDQGFFSFLNPLPTFRLGFFCISAESKGYVIGKNQIIYKVDSNGVFQTTYSQWFPANGPASIVQVIMYKDKLVFLLNNYEIWLFDPNQINIDYSRPGALNIVNL